MTILACVEQTLARLQDLQLEDCRLLARIVDRMLYRAIEERELIAEFNHKEDKNADD